MKIYSEKEWRAEGERLFGKDKNQWRFKCCNCGHEQTINDFKSAAIEEPENKVFFSCIGRWTNGPGTIGNSKSPCNYTLGGLLMIGNVKVVDEGGQEHNVFEFGAPVNETAKV